MTNSYRFAGYPGAATVASFVTTVVCAWFVAAGGAMLADRHSEHTIENARAPSIHVTAVETPTGLAVTATRAALTM
jgi:hypothetical protein